MVFLVVNFYMPTIYNNETHQMGWNFDFFACFSINCRFVNQKQFWNCVWNFSENWTFCELFFFSLHYLGFFLFPRLKAFSIARQDTECERETVTFNSSFFEFMVAFLGVDLSDCPCEDRCPNVGKFVKLYLYRTYVRQTVRFI